MFVKCKLGSMRELEGGLNLGGGAMNCCWKVGLDVFLIFFNFNVAMW